ncbi:hypothetical protein [Nonomuraea sp. NPDC049504]
MSSGEYVVSRWDTLGGVLTACIAFPIDWLGGLAEHALKPRGM